MQKMFFVEKEQVALMKTLLDRRIDNEYVVLYNNGQFADIAQYSDKYQNVHLASVLISALDPTMRLA